MMLVSCLGRLVSCLGQLSCLVQGFLGTVSTEHVWHCDHLCLLAYIKVLIIQTLNLLKSNLWPGRGKSNCEQRKTKQIPDRAIFANLLELNKQLLKCF